jgi:folate-dependent phosphoribosylglycinamide formyltransferase PurN
MKYSVTVFAYDFCHKKTHDILISLKLHGISNVLVIAAPMIKLNHKTEKKTFKSEKSDEVVHPSKICANFNYIYQVCSHDNVSEIKRHTLKNLSNIAIISGARIIKKNIIDLFYFGIINYHPGPLPETSGLDSIYWMIKKNAKPLASAHFIDSRVDAGELIEEYHLKVKLGDTLEIIKNNLYCAQLKLHSQICQKIINNEIFKTKKIVRPFKNNLMTEKQKKIALTNFESWKNYYSIKD